MGHPRIGRGRASSRSETPRRRAPIGWAAFASCLIAASSGADPASDGLQPAQGHGLGPAHGTAHETTPFVEVITMSPGEELYTLWGHAALRVVDRERHIDLIYNYGSIDLSASALDRMLRGQVEAFLHVGSFERMSRTYAGHQDRTIERRRLDLDPELARALIDRLAQQSSGPKWSYRYDHLYDNCSTRVADEIDVVLGRRLSKAFAGQDSKTFREYALSAIKAHPWLFVGVDTALSGAADRPISRWDTRFMPVGLMAVLDEGVVNGRPLVGERSVIYRSKRVGVTSSPHAAIPSIDPASDEVLRRTWWPGEDATWPWTWVFLFVTGPLVLLGLGAPRAAAITLSVPSGLVGAALLLLHLGTTYDFLRGNWNSVVFPASNLVLLVPLVRRGLTIRWDRCVRAYFALYALTLIVIGVSALIGAIAQPVLPQVASVLPPVIVLAFRWRGTGRS